MVWWVILIVCILLFLIVLFSMFKVAARADEQLERQREEFLRMKRDPKD